MKKQDILDYLKDHKEYFKEQYGVESIGIFGSYARDEATKESDIDIFANMKPDIISVIELKSTIEEDLKINVDLVRNHKNIRPFLYQMIQKDIVYV